MKKVFDQTVRDIKREVNKKVLKVPGIEQKVLDATSNEPWGPHGTLLADIAQATRNYHEYQMIMAVIWKRINDTGKNWRHVYKALTVLEYLVAHGSERVIDDIREHSYQIQTLSDFQYIDSSGRDQGSNVRKKSQSLVVLVNDKERIIEVRQKAAVNRDKFRSASSTGGMYKPGGYGDRYDDDRYEGRYGGRDEDRNGYGYGREREMGYRDDDRYGRYGDSNSRDGDRYGRDYEERYSRDGYKDDDYRGRSRSVDDYQYGPRSRSTDRDRDRPFDDDGQYSSRGSGGRAEDQTPEGRQLERKFSEQNISAPPSYEEAVGESQSPAHTERDGKPPAASVPRAASPVSNIPSQATTTPSTQASPQNQEVEASDEFDPRGSVSAAPVTSNNAEMDLFGSLSDSFSNSLAIVPTASVTTTSEADVSVPAPNFVAAPSTSNIVNQPFADPFGDSPFKAVPSTDSVPTQQQTSASTNSFLPNGNQTAEPAPPGAQGIDTVSNFGFGDTLSGLTYSGPNASSSQPPTNTQYFPQELSAPQENTDILADILPPSGHSPTFASQPPFAAPTGQPALPAANIYGTFHPQAGSIAPQIQAGPPAQFLPQAGSLGPPTSQMTAQTPAGPTSQLNGGNLFMQQGGSASPITSHVAPQAPAGPGVQFNSGNFLPAQGAAAPVTSHIAHQTPTGPAVVNNHDLLGNALPQAGFNAPVTSLQSLPSSTGSLSIVPQPANDKFETKSTVWADTLSRGLVNLNISGAKINPLADIGIDFDAINRKEKRMEKPTTNPVTSTVNMGKAMGSGSGMGRAGAGALRPPTNPMVGSGMGMGMARGPSPGMGMAGYGGMNQPMGVGMGMGMGMNMGMGQGGQMQQPTGFPPGSNIPGGYNPMLGPGGYVPQQPYGGGYR